MEAIILIGIQGAGKTTFYRERFLETHVRISLDMLRTRRREQLLLTACLNAGQRFVIDNTNPTVDDRAPILPQCRAAGFRVIAYYLQIALRDAIARNNARPGKQRVPVPAMISAFNRLQVPTLDEGFDEVHTIKFAPAK